MSAYTPVTLNVGAGGPLVDTLPVSDGTQMPVSALAVSADGVADPLPVTGLRPLPVVDSTGSAATAGLTISTAALATRMDLIAAQLDDIKWILMKAFGAPEGERNLPNQIVTQ